MNIIISERAIALTTTALAFTSVYGYMQFGVSSLIVGFFVVIFAVSSLALKKPLLTLVSNAIFASVSMGQSLLANSSNLVNDESACLDICIGSDLPLLFIKSLSVVIFLLASALLVKRLVENK